MGAYLRPRDVGEAVGALASGSPSGRPWVIVAGATDHYPARVGTVTDEDVLDISALEGLRGVKEIEGGWWIGALTTWTDLIESYLPPQFDAIRQAARTIGGQQIQNRGTIGGNLGTASPAGDALPPLLIEGAAIELASVRGVRTVPLADFLVGPKRNALDEDELITAVTVQPSGAPQTFMKIGPRNAMVISVASLALVVDRERGELRAAYGSAGPVPALVVAPLDEVPSFPERVAEAAAPIDDVRGSAAYRRHALRVLTSRAVERCLAA